LYVPRYTTLSHGARQFSEFVIRTEDTKCPTGLSYCGIIMEYAHGEYRSMHLTLGVCHIRAGTSTRE